ncbi:hypothetical protein FQN55_005034 [Onygenales sp. PD_40]|nr:hypothetical protein FQN55_005034 [Onygenales sp. PD_40]
MEEDHKYGITVLYQPPCSNDILYDLVAVHGLNGDPFETWTHKKNRVMWLRDLLPSELPNVRIMTYGYNAKFRNFTGRQDMRNIAMKLLAELVDLRKTAEALLIRGPKEQTIVQDATHGIIFLATPHSGSAIADSGKVLANIIHACSPFRPARTLLGFLRRDSKVLFEITEDFVEKVAKLNIVSFFEMEMTNFRIFKRLVVEEHSAILNVPNEIPIGQYADHRDIARFSSYEDRNFRPVMTRLLTFKDDIAGKNISLTTNLGAPTSDEGSIFEIPFTECSTFRGREDLLQSIERYFSQPNPNGQLIYALTGLGGSGKTHCALQYALRNRPKYPDGVVYFNASSNAALSASFHRTYDLLDLGNAANKIDHLRQWFAKPKNHQWLMVFDNADDLESVSLSRYFPSCAWGHIIVTTRDQGAVGHVAPDGCAVPPLGEDDSVAVLLAKSGTWKPTEDDIKEAKTISNFLGHLPLAVEQAGAFIRRRGKTLKDYHRLLKNKQYEILKITPGIGGHEKTVATVWELNFRQLEKEGAEASHLLELLSFLDGTNIPESMLRKGCSNKTTWGTNGETIDITPEDAGLDPHLVALINNEMRFDQAIEQLLSFSLIQPNKTRNGERAFTVHPLVQHCVSHRIHADVRQKWQIQAILLVAHAFPFSDYIDQDFGRFGREVFAHVPRILEAFDEIMPSCDGYSTLKRAVCVLLLSTSIFSHHPWKQECIRRLKHLLADECDSYLAACATYRESQLLWLQGKIAESNKVLEEHIGTVALSEIDDQTPPDARYNAMQGNLIVSFSRNLIRNNDLHRARKEVEAWQPVDPNSPSTMEGIVLQTRNVMLGRILRNQGLFQEALSYCEKLLEPIVSGNSPVLAYDRKDLLANVADLYCEVGRPADAEVLVERELENLRAKGSEHKAAGRRMRRALAESFVRRGMFEEAEDHLSKLVPLLEVMKDQDIHKFSAYFCVLVGLARISHLQGHWDKALERWSHARDIVEGAGWTPGSSHGIVLYSLAQALYRSGKVEESRVTYEAAEKSLAAEERKYWIVGLGSYWYDYVVTPLGGTGPNPVVKEPKGIA